MPEVVFPTPQFPAATGLGIAANGSVYIGEPDTDPTVLANRISVTIIDTDGSSVVIPGASQPFDLNDAGMFDYQGSIVQLRTSQNYSISVYTSTGALLYYFPNAAVTSSVLTSVIQLAATTTPATVSGSGQIYAKSSGGGVEFFYQDGNGNEVQITSGGQLNVDLPNDNVTVNSLFSNYFLGKVVELESVSNEINLDWRAGQYFSFTNTETTTLNFTNMPAIGEGIGQTVVFFVDDAGNFAITLSPETGYTVYARSSDNPLTLTTDGLDAVFLTVYSSGNLIAVPLHNFVVNGS